MTVELATLLLVLLMLGHVLVNEMDTRRILRTLAPKESLEKPKDKSDEGNDK